VVTVDAHVSVVFPTFVTAFVFALHALTVSLEYKILAIYRIHLLVIDQHFFRFRNCYERAGCCFAWNFSLFILSSG